MLEKIPLSYTLVDDALIERLSEGNEKLSWLFLAPSDDFQGEWAVESFNSSFYFDFKDLIGAYRTVSPSRLGEFLDLAKDLNYQVAFFEDPAKILDVYEHLEDPPQFPLDSHFENTVGGLLPHQLQGFNYLKDLNAGVALHSTGTGKTVVMSALLKYHASMDTFDTAWVVVKAHNKINTQRTLSKLAHLDSIVIDGSKKKRLEAYEALAESRGTIAITNYEKFRDDFAEIKKYNSGKIRATPNELGLSLFEGRDILCVYDEMPTKLKTRSTRLYQSVVACLYDTVAPAVSAEKRRPSTLRQYMLSATPIENDPEDFFNCVRILDPNIFGTVANFREEFVDRYSFFDASKPEAWKDLDKIGRKASHIVHEVDKNDPDIAKMFPKVIDEPYYIDWDPADKKIYDKAVKDAVEYLDANNVLPLIGLLQMLCCAPTMVNDSAARREAFEDALETWESEGGSTPTPEGSEAAMRLLEYLEGKLTDDRHTKIKALHELLTEKHPEDKFVVFSAFNDGLLPILTRKFKEWGVNYVRYSGTDKQRQDAHDKFTNDPDVRVFLSSDKGSDSINLEVASVVVNYDLPWKWSTLTQRQNRIHRVTSGFSTVNSYSLLMADSIEDRKLQIIKRKEGYHDGVFSGSVSDQAISSRMSSQDLIYILTGN